MVRQLSPEKRTNLMHAALKLFTRKGVANTSTAEIAREAGTAAGTLFLYFPTKQALLDELALDLGKEQSTYIKQRLDRTVSAQEMFFTIWQGSVHWFLENPEAFQYIQQVREARMISEAAVQESNAFFDYYYDAIQKGLKEGRIKTYPIDLIGDFLYHDIVAVVNHLRRHPNSSAEAETIRQGFEIFWDGIRSGAWAKK